MTGRTDADGVVRADRAIPAPSISAAGPGRVSALMRPDRGILGFDYSTRMFVFGATEGAGQSDRASRATQKGNANASGTTGDR